jgi:membrane associated rhomboid family serine protease
LLIIGKTLHRSFSQRPKNLSDPKQSQHPAFSEIEWTASTDDASKARRFEQYLTTPVEDASGKVRTTADVLVTENSRTVRSSFIYVTLIGLAVFGGAAALSQADSKSLARDTPGSNPSIKAMRATRERHELGAAQRSVDALRKYLGEGIVKYYAQMRLAYLNASDGKKAAYMIGGVNVAVFLGWQVSLLALRSPRAPNLYSFMRRWFLHAPLTPQPFNRAITPITSTFSHISTIHLALNTICMVSFATGAGYYISSVNVQSGDKFQHGYREQELSGTYHFLAFFIAAGIFSSLGSTLHAQYLQKGVLRSLQPKLDAYRLSNMPGLGASGAVYSVLVVSTFADPDVRIGIIGLSNLFPFLNVEKKYGVTALVALDIFGLLAGWRTFGHAAHLGGAAFGAAYAFFGPQIWARIRGSETRLVN